MEVLVPARDGFAVSNHLRNSCMVTLVFQGFHNRFVPGKGVHTINIFCRYTEYQLPAYNWYMVNPIRLSFALPNVNVSPSLLGQRQTSSLMV